MNSLISLAVKEMGLRGVDVKVPSAELNSIVIRWFSFSEASDT
jgi:hypothetical protein